MLQPRQSAVSGNIGELVAHQALVSSSPVVAVSRCVVVIDAEHRFAGVFETAPPTGGMFGSGLPDRAGRRVLASTLGVLGHLSPYSG